MKHIIPGKSLTNCNHNILYGSHCLNCEREKIIPNITCPQCGMVSYNTNDIEQKYCGNCDEFHKDINALQKNKIEFNIVVHEYYDKNKLVRLPFDARVFVFNEIKDLGVNIFDDHGSHYPVRNLIFQIEMKKAIETAIKKIRKAIRKFENAKA